MEVRLYPGKRAMGRAAAEYAAAILRGRREARIIIGTGPSQDETIDAVVAVPGLPWPRITVFHMDEYVGMPADHPESFRRWLRTRVADVVHPGQVHYLGGDAADLEVECRRYAALLQAAPIDIAFLGFGENGHIAFNDPHVADFHDPAAVKVVEMDLRCRQQQVGEGHFPTVESMPRQALTLTCPVLLGAEYAVCSVPDRRKAEAVRDALEGPVTTRCPASGVRTHAHAVVFLDRESASLLANPPAPAT